MQGLGRAYRDGAALAHDRDDCVVAARPARGRVDDEPDGLVLDEREGRGGEHLGDVAFAEDLLERVEGEAGELGLDEVRAVLFCGIWGGEKSGWQKFR
jgi:hypothetical protein